MKPIKLIMLLGCMLSLHPAAGKPFRVAFVGDPQVNDLTELDYARKSIYKELRERSDLDLVIVLGDLVNDRTDLLAPSKASLDSLGCMWVCAPGNHDKDLYKGKESRTKLFHNKPRDLSSFSSTIGSDTSFVAGGIRFCIMNNVRTVGRADYECGFSESQKHWLAEAVFQTPPDMPLVIATHIPLSQMKASDSLDVILAPHRDKLLLVAGHTHYVYRGKAYGADEVVAGASCGSFWRGLKDDSGVPLALMNCGSPRGYFVADINADKPSGWYSLEYKCVSRDKRECAAVYYRGDSLIVNVFGGSPEGVLQAKVKGAGKLGMHRGQVIDPHVQQLIDMNLAASREERKARKSEFIPLLRRNSPHVWVSGSCEKDIEGRTVTLKYSDPSMKFKTRQKIQ